MASSSCNILNINDTAASAPGMVVSTHEETLTAATDKQELNEMHNALASQVAREREALEIKCAQAIAIQQQESQQQQTAFHE